MKTLLLISALLAAQTAPPRASGVIEGAVVNSITMLPLADTPITLTGGPSPIGAISDQAGRFLIPNLPAGPYTVVGELENYFGQEPGASVYVMEGQTSRIMLSMSPAGVIGGAVVDDGGSPAAGVRVQLMRIVYPNGLPTLSNAGSQSTDDRGYYRIAGLRPGEYYVAAAPKQTPGAAAVLVRTFFPSAIDLSQASLVRLHAGEEASGVHISLRKGDVFRILGQVVSAIPDSGGNSTVTLLPHGSALQEPNSFRTVSIAMASPSNGRFELADVLPGIYDVYASLPASRGNVAAYGRITVTVNGGNQEGVNVAVQRGVDVQGKVTVDGGASPSFNSVRISLQAEDTASGLPGYQQVSRFQPAIDLNGVFTIPAVPEAQYRVHVTFAVAAPTPTRVVVPPRPVDPLAPDPTPPPALVTVPLAGSPLGANAYVADILQGGRSVFNTGILVGTQAFDALEVQVRTDGGAVDGLVLDGQLRPYAGATVVLAPLVQYRQNPALFRSATSDETGRFSMTGIRPGEYKLLAWESIQAGAFMNADVLSNYKDKEFPVTVPANIHVETKVTVIPSRN